MYSTYFPPQYSGAAKQAISLARHLRNRGNDVEFVTVRWPGLKEKDSYDEFPVHRLEAGRGRKHRELRLWWNFLRYALGRRKDFDILHSHGAYYTNSIIGPLAKLSGWKSLIKASLADNDLHGLRNSLAGRVHLRFLRMVNAYVAISVELEREFMSADLPAGKIYHLPNGVDTERFHPLDSEKKKTLRKALGLPENHKIALTAGVFDERKNIGWLMEEWIRTDAFGTGIYLVAVGPQSREDKEGTFLNYLKQLASEHREILCLRDYTDDISQYYQASDFFILPSLSEGMPNVILEAMASGLPCIATRVSGVQELVRDGETGYAFSIQDGLGLQEAVKNILENLDGVIGRQARELVEKKYSLTALAEQYEGLYRRLADGRTVSLPKVKAPYA